MIRLINRLLSFGPVLLFGVLITAACADTEPAPPLPGVGFAHLQPISLKVAAVERVLDYQATLAQPNVEHRFSTPPAKAALNWAERRLDAAGGTATARFMVTDASVVEVPVEKKLTGFRAYFTSEVTVDYRARLAAQLVIEAPNSRPSVVSVVATRNMTMLEDASLAEREKVWFDMTEALMADFDREMENNIRTLLSQWVVE